MKITESMTDKEVLDNIPNLNIKTYPAWGSTELEYDIKGFECFAYCINTPVITETESIITNKYRFYLVLGRTLNFESLDSNERVKYTVSLENEGFDTSNALVYIYINRSKITNKIIGVDFAGRNSPMEGFVSADYDIEDIPEVLDFIVRQNNGSTTSFIDKNSIYPMYANFPYIESDGSLSYYSRFEYIPIVNPYITVKTQPGQSETAIDSFGGTGDRTSDVISKPVDPINGNTFSSTSYIVNFWSVYGLKKFFWSNGFLEMIANLLNSPQSAIISCNLFPFDLLEGVDSSKTNEVEELKIGTMPWPLPELSEVAYKVNWSYNKVLTVGEYELEPFYGGFLDFAPYTKINIHLPYAGDFNVDPSLITGKILKVYYVVDIVSGEGKAILESKGKEEGSIFVEIASYPCMLSSQMFFSSTDKNQSVGNFTTSILTGGVMSLATGNPLPVLGSVVGNSTMDVMTTPQTVQSNASVTSILERTLSQDVYLTITRPETAVPNDYNKIYGRPSQITMKLSDCMGFTSCDNVHLNISCTKKELEMIENLLKEGVVIK